MALKSGFSKLNHSNNRKHGNEIEQQALFPNFSDTSGENDQDIDSAQDILNKEGISFEYVDDPFQAQKAVDRLIEESKPLGIDTETAKLADFFTIKNLVWNPICLKSD